MIRLNTEKGIVRIESWDDITSRPGFRERIDPKQAKLKAIIGSYQCVIRRMPVQDSAACRSSIPRDAGPRFRGMPVQ
jgi:hypothetical protein